MGLITTCSKILSDYLPENSVFSFPMFSLATTLSFLLQPANKSLLFFLRFNSLVCSIEAQWWGKKPCIRLHGGVLLVGHLTLIGHWPWLAVVVSAISGRGLTPKHGRCTCPPSDELQLFGLYHTHESTQQNSSDFPITLHVIGTWYKFDEIAGWFLFHIFGVVLPWRYEHQLRNFLCRQTCCGHRWALSHVVK